MRDVFLPDTFTNLPAAKAIAHWLIHDDPAQGFSHVTEARIGYLLQQPMLTLRGEPCAAYIATAGVQGPNHLAWQFFAAQFVAGADEPWPLDFLVYLDAATWDTAAKETDEIGPSGHPILREAILFHELCHLRQLATADGELRWGDDGRPLLALTRHTYEFFSHDIRRYGPRTLGLTQAALDLAHGAREEETRHKASRRRRSRLRAV